MILYYQTQILSLRVLQPDTRTIGIRRSKVVNPVKFEWTKVPLNNVDTLVNFKCTDVSTIKSYTVTSTILDSCFHKKFYLNEVVKKTKWYNIL